MTVRVCSKSIIASVTLGLASLVSVGCGTVGVFNPAFVNTLVGGQVPVTPGPAAAFVLVRGVNETPFPVEFIVTIQRNVLVVDDQGNAQVDETGEFVTRPERETVRLQTFPNGTARELGALFACGESPVTHVGLGESLLPSDVAVFVGGQGTGGAEGAGVRAENINPLSWADGNFNCGDTIIFRAFRATGIAGGVGVHTFLLPGSEQPSIFDGPSTFANLEQFLEAQVREEEP